MLVNAGKAVIRGRIEANTTPTFPTSGWYAAISADATSPALGDTALTGELSGNGLSRAVVTATHTTGQNQWSYSITFTFTGSTPQAINSIAIFDAASSGNMITHDVLPAPVTVSVNGDAVPFTLTFAL